jgi:hypothetical protein
VTRYDRQVHDERNALGARETDGKLTPTEAGLTGPHSTNQCIDCVRFVREGRLYGRCALVWGPGRIAADGTCNFLIAGEPKRRIDPEDYAPILSKPEAGYQERAGGFHCEDCAFWDRDPATGEPTERCRIVAGPILARQCCNYYRDRTGEAHVSREDGCP